MNANLRNFALWVIIVLLLLALFTLFQNPGQRTTAQDISFSQLLNEVDQGHVRDVVEQLRERDVLRGGALSGFWNSVNSASSKRTIITQRAKLRRLAFIRRPYPPLRALRPSS